MGFENDGKKEKKIEEQELRGNRALGSITSHVDMFGLRGREKKNRKRPDGDPNTFETIPEC